MNRNQKYVIDPIKDDLIFQIIGWYAVDYEYDNDVENESDDASKYLIKVFGNTEGGASVALNILNYTPYFYIKVNHKCDKYTAEHIHEYVVGKLPRKLKNGLIDVTLLKKKDFWGFTNNEKFTFARLKFKNINAYKSAIRLFYKAVLISSIAREPIKYKLYESNIDPFLRMMHIRDIQPCGWIELKKTTYEHNTYNLPSSCQIDIECDWRAVMKHEKEKIAPILVASFDLECTSSHGDFPIARKNYAKVSYELLQYFNAHKLDDYIKDTLQKELLKIFDPNIDGIFSKVFLKHEVKLKDIENKLKKIMDELFTILTGRLNYKIPLNAKKNYFGYSNTTSIDDEKGMSKDAIMIMLTQKMGDFDEERGWIGIFPPLEGDPIIQIGTTTHCYGEKECNYKSILTLGSCDPIEGVEVIACETEKELLMKWRDLIIKLDPDVITGYNIFGFDMSYLYDRSRELGISTDFCKLGRLAGHKCAYVEKSLSSSALGDNLLKYIDMEGRVLIDVMKVVQRDHKLDSYKLDNVASHFMKMNKNDVHPSDIFRLQKGTSEDRRTIADYCVQDCALCNHLIMKLEILANNIGMSNVCNVPLSFIFMRGQGIKIFSLVAKECRAEDFLIPTLSNYIRDNDSDVVEDEEGYEGAIVLPPKEGIYIDTPISVLDYASLYPSSMISENLSHDSIILNKKYDNLPDMEYLDIVYDVYEKIDDKKVKTGEKTVRFAQFPKGEKGTIPKILMKLLRQRKETRKKIEFKTLFTNDNIEYKGLVKEKEDVVIITGLDGKSIEIPRENIKSMDDSYDDFQKAVLDGLQTAYKVTANSLYGQCGAKTSSIYMKEIAACTTATGRKMILMAKDYIEKNYNAETIYGDSVTSYTPILIRHNNLIKIETIEKLANKYGNNSWINCIEEGKQNKESCEILDIETWSDIGWTKLHRVIRHELSKTKKIIRVNTHSGIVDVTDDHSLLKLDGTEISPNNLQIGDSLLHCPFPVINNNCEVHSINEARIMGFFCGDGSAGNYDCPSGKKCSWTLNNSDMKIQEFYRKLCEETYPDLQWKILDTLESSGVYKLVPNAGDNFGGIMRLVNKYREMMYYDKEKVVPVTILNSRFEIRKSFWDGLYDADGDKEDIITRIDQKNQISMAMFNLLGESLGFKTSLNTRTDKENIFRLNLTKNTQRKDPNKIKKMYEIPYTGFVYDLTTDNHHFQAGVGKMIVHNTDSCFFHFPTKDSEGNPIKGKDAVMPSIKMAMEASKTFKQYLKAPHDFEYEKTFFPFILFSKKRYCAMKYEFDDEHCKFNSMGIALKRRDNAQIVKHIYGGCIDIILKEHDVKKSIAFLRDSLNDLIDGKYSLEDLVVSKSLRNDYKDPTRIAHKVLAERMGERDPGNKPQVSDRIPYIYIQVKEEKGKSILQGNRIETPDFIKQNKLKPDYEFYITNQIMKPILQLYALVIEELDGYRKGKCYYKDLYKKLLTDKDGDEKKAKDRWQDLREDEIKSLLFEPLLNKLKNKKQGLQDISKFFQKK